MGTSNWGRPAGAAGLLILAVGAGDSAAAASLNCGTAVNGRFAEAASLCGQAPPGNAVAPADAYRNPGAVSVGYARAARRAPRAVASRGPAPAINPLIHAVGRSYRVDPRLLAAMVRTESAGRQTAVSHKGALGLMQVMPGTARSLGVREPRALLSNPTLALSAGALYLKTLQAKFGNNLPLVVAAYNAGPGAVTKARGIPAYRETQGYVGSVLGRYGALRGR